MKALWCILTVVLVLIISEANAAQQFSDFYFFGDSLSDVGNQSDAPRTSPQGTLWSQQLAQHYNQSVLDSDHNSGTDWANVGARTYDKAGVPGLLTQIRNYLSRGPINSLALYSIWAGANDMNRIQEELFRTTPAVIVSQTITNILSAINQLHVAGVRYIMVLNLADLGKTPRFNVYPPAIAAQISKVVNGFDQMLALKLNQLGYKIIQIDVNSVFNAIIANPWRYGFYDIKTQAKLCNGCDADRYLFWDEVHPTAAGHQLVADTVFSVFQGATNAAVLADTPIPVMNSVNTSISNELTTIRNNYNDLQAGRFRTFFNTGTNPTLHDTETTLLPGYRQSNVALLVGADYRWTKELIIGAAISRSTNTVTFTGNSGSFKLNENMFSLFSSYQFNRFYANGIANIGLIDYRTIQRSINIGAATDNTLSQTTGSHFGGQLEFGYNIFNDKLKSGPFVNTSYQHINVEPYAEENATPGLNLQYFKQENESLVTGIGWQAAYKGRLNNRLIMPFAQISYNKEWLRNRDNIREVDIGLTSIATSRFSIPVGSFPKQGWGVINFGVNVELAKNLSGGLSMQAMVGQKVYRNYGVMASLQLAF